MYPRVGRSVCGVHCSKAQGSLGFATPGNSGVEQPPSLELQHLQEFAFLFRGVTAQRFVPEKLLKYGFQDESVVWSRALHLIDQPTVATAGFHRDRRVRGECARNSRYNRRS